MRISDWSSDVCSSDLGIIPLQFLKAVLPEPASLGETTRGKTNIGDIATGQKDGQQKTFYIYNVCDHEDAYAETGNQAVRYTTGVPDMIGAAMILTGAWEGKGVFHMEQFEYDRFMDRLNKARKNGGNGKKI